VGDAWKLLEVPVKRTFASLSAQEALHVAIFIEERNAEIYRQFAEMFAEFRDAESLEIAAAFWDLFNEERRHGSTLQQRYLERYGTSSCTVTEEDISELIEVPRLDNGEIFSVNKVKTGRSPRQMAFAVAIAAEESAARFYRGLADSTNDRELRALYQEFADLEANHSNLLEHRSQEASTNPSGHQG
jgi:rubrerythrin